MTSTGNVIPPSPRTRGAVDTIRNKEEQLWTAQPPP
jgi:hypothetical protein